MIRSNNAALNRTDTGARSSISPVSVSRSSPVVGLVMWIEISGFNAGGAGFAVSTTGTGSAASLDETSSAMGGSLLVSNFFLSILNVGTSVGFGGSLMTIRPSGRFGAASGVRVTTLKG